jgi:hypothetical protein
MHALTCQRGPMHLVGRSHIRDSYRNTNGLVSLKLGPLPVSVTYINGEKIITGGNENRYVPQVANSFRKFRRKISNFQKGTNQRKKLEVTLSL